MKSLKTEDEEGSTNFIKEATTLEALSHNNIVQFYGIYSDSANTYMVTEFMDQGSLRDLVMSDKSLTNDILDKMALDAASGMAYLEHNSMIHGDLGLSMLSDLQR